MLDLKAEQMAEMMDTYIIPWGISITPTVNPAGKSERKSCLVQLGNQERIGRYFFKKLQRRDNFSTWLISNQLMNLIGNTKAKSAHQYIFYKSNQVEFPFVGVSKNDWLKLNDQFFQF